MFKYKELNEKFGNQTLQNVRKYENLSNAKARFQTHLHFNLHCKHHNIIPKSLRIRSPIDSTEARRVIEKARKALLYKKP